VDEAFSGRPPGAPPSATWGKVKEKGAGLADGPFLHVLPVYRDPPAASGTGVFALVVDNPVVNSMLATPVTTGVGVGMPGFTAYNKIDGIGGKAGMRVGW